MDKIVCIGKNYADHVKEMATQFGDKSAPAPKPVLFLKPPSVLKVAKNGETLSAYLPPDAGAIHHECEIVLRIDRGGFRMNAADARKAIGAVTLGLDMTRRDLQTKLKGQGHPWTTSKVFLDSAVIGPWRPLVEFTDFLAVPFRFSLDGVAKQEGLGSRMITSPVDCVAYISECFPLVEGDLIFTGTPAGVGPVAAGQTAHLSWGQLDYSVKWSTWRE